MDVTPQWRSLARSLDAAGQSAIVRPLAHVVRRMGVRVLGIAGAPGAGKSTIARLLADEMRSDDGEPLVISLDDYYLSRSQRISRGLVWRGPPGSHDVPALLEVLDRISHNDAPVTVQRFSAEIDDRIEPHVIERSPGHVVLEGWVLGHDEGGYEQLLDRLDLLVFIDVPDEVARTRRFEREAILRARGGGFSEDEMQRFWDEILAPGMSRWVQSARASADLLLATVGDGTLRQVITSSPLVMASLEGHQ